MIDLKVIDAIIFDLDGTLVDSMWIWKQIDIEFLEKRGIALPDDLQKSIEGMSFTETAHYFKERFALEEPIRVIQEEWHQMAVTFYEHRIPLKEDALNLIEKAIGQNIKLGIGTSNSKELLMTVLKTHGIDKHFKTLRTSCEVAAGKPQPDIFLKVAEDLTVSPERCLVFEDTYAGVKAAKNAGMRVIAVYDELSEAYRNEIEAIADGYIMNFSEILKYIS